MNEGMMMNSASQVETMLDTSIEDDPVLDESDGFPPVPTWNDDGDGDDPRCDWGDNVCELDPEYYIVYLCGDPDCRESHVFHYCKRHYLLRLGKTLRSLKRHADEYREYARNADERRAITLRFVSDFGRMPQA